MAAATGVVKFEKVRPPSQLPWPHFGSPNCTCVVSTATGEFAVLELRRFLRRELELVLLLLLLPVVAAAPAPLNFDSVKAVCQSLSLVHWVLSLPYTPVAMSRRTCSDDGEVGGVYDGDPQVRSGSSVRGRGAKPLRSQSRNCPGDDYSGWCGEWKRAIPCGSWDRQKDHSNPEVLSPRPRL